MYHIQNTVPIVHQIRQAQSSSTLYSGPGGNEDADSLEDESSVPCSTNSVEHPSPSTKQEHVQWYSRLFGTMTLQKKSKFYKSTNEGAEGRVSFVSETAWMFRPSYISYALQLRYSRSFGCISRSLRLYPVLSDHDPVFKMCQEGDLVGLQTALSRKGQSPFVIGDSSGATLLHVSISIP